MSIVILASLYVGISRSSQASHSKCHSFVLC